MNKSSLTIRPLGAIDEYSACEEIQRLAWHTGDELVVPAHMLLTLAKTGGLLLGAFDARGRMVGFVLGILARQETSQSQAAPVQGLRHHSHMLGVHPDWWGRGVGYRLKLAQREAVLAQGLALVTWTFDPLERRNATLNFAKLGVVCRTYLVDLYGEMDDSLNVGLPSDRFQVDWWLRSERVERRVAGERPDLDVTGLVARGVPLVNPATSGQDGLLRPAEAPTGLGGEQLLVQVPADLQALKRTDLSLARAWRTTTRAIFQSAFDQGYVATEYLHQAGQSYYLLKRKT
jgi:predicted GNAT superfamily acetyltransferase